MGGIPEVLPSHMINYALPEEDGMYIEKGNQVDGIEMGMLKGQHIVCICMYVLFANMVSQISLLQYPKPFICFVLEK